MNENHVRTIEQVQYFCEVMGNEKEEDFSRLSETERAWQNGYTQAMKHILLWIKNSDVVMVPMSQYKKVSE